MKQVKEIAVYPPPLLIFNTARKQSNLFSFPRRCSQQPHVFMFFFLCRSSSTSSNFCTQFLGGRGLRYKPHIQNQFLCYRQDEWHKQELVCDRMAKEITNACNLWGGLLILHPRNTSFLQRSKLMSVESQSQENIHVNLIRL